MGLLSETAFRTDPALSAGDVLVDRYRIVRLLGCGGLGRKSTRLWINCVGEPIALKTLRADVAGNDAVLRQFQKEIQLARRVTHPNVCRIYEAGVHGASGAGRQPLHFFTMELLDGETLRDRIRRTGRLTRRQAFPIAAQMASGLAAAHTVGIVHRDFKSSNVMLVGEPEADRAVVTDFGLARRERAMTAAASSVSLSVAGAAVAGTVAYMSPEQLTGGEVTPASDIYSFGIVLFEMAAGCLPFDDRHVIKAAVQRFSGENASVRSLVPDIDPRWEAAIGRCLERDPRRRFHSAVQLEDWFRENRFQLPRLYWSRRQWVRAGACSAVAVTAGGGAWVWLHQPYKPLPAALEWYEKGVAALHSMTYEAARKELEQAVAADPHFALAHASLAQAYAELDYSERAKDAMLKALSEAGESRLSRTDRLRVRAWKFTVARDYDRAAPLFAQLEVNAGEREKAAAALESGWVEEKASDTLKSIEAYLRARTFDPQYAAANLRLGVMLGRQRKVEEALKTFSEAEKLYEVTSDYEGLTETLFQIATLLNRSSRSAETIARIEKALAVTSATGNVYQQVRLRLLQSVTYRNLGDADRATDLARDAVETASRNGMESIASRGILDLGNALFVRREPDAAERYFQQGLTLARQSKTRQSEARALLALGSLRVRYGRMEEAKPFIEAAIAIYGPGGYRRELTQASLLLGDSHTELGEFDEGARILSETAVTVDQHDRELGAQVHAAYGSVLEAQGAWPTALAEYEKSSQLRIGRALVIAWLDCANLYWRLGRVEDAEHAFSEAGELIDGAQGEQLEISVRLLRRRAEMAFGLSRFAEALQLARKAVEEAVGKEIAEARGASLIGGLSSIRLGYVAAGLSNCNQAIQGWEREFRPVKTASARLLLAKTLAMCGETRDASVLAHAAREFFEPRRVAEAVWQAYWVEAEGTRGSVVATGSLAAARLAPR